MVGSKSKVKSFEIDKRLVHEAWMKVQANGGAPGVDAVSIDGFREAERDNLYKLWNRMSSGSYLPGPVRAVEIPKDHGRGSGCWVCPMWPTESPRQRRRCCWRRSWSRSSTPTATVTVLGVRPTTRWP